MNMHEFMNYIYEFAYEYAKYELQPMNFVICLYLQV